MDFKLYEQLKEAGKEDPVFKPVPKEEIEAHRKSMKAVDDPAVIDALDRFEAVTVNTTGIRNISGGFAHAEIYDYDDEFFDIELKWGIQSDVEDEVNTENYKMDRFTLEITEA